MFFKPKCSDCGKRNPIVHADHVATMTNGNLTFHYCLECNQKRESDRERYERAKQKQYENLKREMELNELEEKAKLLGIY